jgi:hypothetical protein
MDAQAKEREAEMTEEWIASEKGNTWLCDDDGNHVAWLRMGDRILEVSVTPDNNPGLYARLLSPEESSNASIAEHICKNLSGWYVRRCNLEGVRTNPDGTVR